MPPVGPPIAFGQRTACPCADHRGDAARDPRIVWDGARFAVAWADDATGELRASAAGLSVRVTGDDRQLRVYLGPDVLTVTVPPGPAPVVNVNFGEAPTSISGRAYLDLNASGAREIYRQGLANESDE